MSRKRSRTENERNNYATRGVTRALNEVCKPGLELHMSRCGTLCETSSCASAVPARTLWARAKQTLAVVCWRSCCCTSFRACLVLLYTKCTSRAVRVRSAAGTLRKRIFLRRGFVRHFAASSRGARVVGWCGALTHRGVGTVASCDRVVGHGNVVHARLRHRECKRACVTDPGHPQLGPELDADAVRGLDGVDVDRRRRRQFVRMMEQDSALDPWRLHIEMRADVPSKTCMRVEKKLLALYHALMERYISYTRRKQIVPEIVGS